MVVPCRVWRKQDMQESKATLLERLEVAKQELAAVKQSNDEVKAKVAAQSIQLPEFQRMIGERRAREEKLRGVQGEIEEVQREKWQMEVEVTRQGKALQDAAKAYTASATRWGCCTPAACASRAPCAATSCRGAPAVRMLAPPGRTVVVLWDICCDPTAAVVLLLAGVCRLHMLPLGAKRAGGFDYSLSLSLHANKWDQILGNQHRLKGEMRTWLVQVVEEHHKAGAECDRETIASEAELARLQAEADRLQSEHLATQSQLEKVRGTSQPKEPAQPCGEGAAPVPTDQVHTSPGPGESSTHGTALWQGDAEQRLVSPWAPWAVCGADGCGHSRGEGAIPQGCGGHGAARR